MEETNYQIRLAKRSEGLPTASDWKLTQSSIQTPQPGEVLIKVIYISMEPAMRGWIKDRKSYLPPVAIDDVMRAAGVGKVIASQHPDFEPGCFVAGRLGVQQYATLPGEELDLIDATYSDLPIYLSTLGTRNMLGHPGMTAYFGLLEIGKPVAGEYVVISAAAGGVGLIAGQIAKIKGCKVIGITSSDTKCQFLTENLGFDSAINYKTQDLNAKLEAYCPNGIDIYYDNVGGNVLNTCLGHLAHHARVVICGSISQYNETTALPQHSNYTMLLFKRASMKGFLVTDFIRDYPTAAAQLAEWIKSGQLKTREEILTGIERFPDAFQRLFNGEKIGKLILKV